MTHTAKVITKRVQLLYKENGGFQLDHDLLIAGALLHDVGKLVEIREKDAKW